jgi:hypothetical protein
MSRSALSRPIPKQAKSGDPMVPTQPQIYQTYTPEMIQAMANGLVPIPGYYDPAYYGSMFVAQMPGQLIPAPAQAEEDEVSIVIFFSLSSFPYCTRVTKRMSSPFTETHPILISTIFSSTTSWSRTIFKLYINCAHIMKQLVFSPFCVILLLTSSSDEIHTSVKHVEPWSTGTARTPSTAFCLLVKFLLMRLTRKQMLGLINTGDSPYVRAIGFLYLRYTCPPKDLWAWFEPYLEDEEVFTPSSDVNISMTIGQYLIKLLTEMQYFNTPFPRIPVPIERNFKVMLLLLADKQKRRKSNQKDEERGKFCKGAKVLHTTTPHPSAPLHISLYS